MAFRLFCGVTITIVIALVAYQVQRLLYPVPNHPFYINLEKVKDSYDFIVVGAGAAGSVVAGRLASHESRPNVLLIEAGKKASRSVLSSELVPAKVAQNQRGDIDWEYFYEPLKNFYKSKNESIYKNDEIYSPRGKITGGTAVLNYCMYVRGNRADYDHLWDVDGWKYNDLLPVFKSLENVGYIHNEHIDEKFRGKNGPMGVNTAGNSSFCDDLIRGSERLGTKYNPDYNSGDQFGVTYTQFNIRGHRMNSYISFMHFLLGSDQTINLDILTDTQVTKLVSNSAKNKIIAVETLNLQTKEAKTISVNEKKGGEIILSAGSFESPKLLMLSGIGPKAQLKAHNIPLVRDVPGVGKNLQDHPCVWLRYKLRDDIEYSSLTGKSTSGLPTLLNYILNGQGVFNTTGSDLQWFLNAKSGEHKNYPDSQIILVNSALDVSFMQQFFNLKSSNEFDFYDQTDLQGDWDIENNFFDTRQIIMIPIVLHPKTRGQLTLKSNDPLQHPKIEFNFMENEQDVKILQDLVRYSNELLLNTPEGKKYIEKEIEMVDENGKLAGVRGTVRRRAHLIYHPVGTCKMVNDFSNHNAKDGVVNKHLLVRGFDNLRVADASIMPTLPSGNTQVPCYMIGGKAAEMILKKWES